MYQGLPRWATNITAYLDSHDIAISHVLLTHWHADHTGGVDDLRQYDPGVAVHKRRPGPGQRAIADGQTFRTQGATLRAVATPGHAADHTCFVLAEEDALFTGDNVLGHGYSVAEDLGAYTRSLRRMAGLGCATGYPGHGAVVRDLPQAMARYIAQRDARERRVYAALAKEGQAARAGSPRPQVRDGARRSSSAHEEHLRACTDERVDRIQVAPETHGLSIADIGRILYGEAARDQATFDFALKPLLSQVLFMLAEQGKVGFRLAGLDMETQYWFARDGMCT